MLNSRGVKTLARGKLVHQPYCTQKSPCVSPGGYAKTKPNRENVFEEAGWRRRRNDVGWGRVLEGPSLMVCVLSCALHTRS